MLLPKSLEQVGVEDSMKMKVLYGVCELPRTINVKVTPLWNHGGISKHTNVLYDNIGKYNTAPPQINFHVEVEYKVWKEKLSTTDMRPSQHGIQFFFRDKFNSESKTRIQLRDENVKQVAIIDLFEENKHPKLGETHTIEYPITIVPDTDNERNMEYMTAVRACWLHGPDNYITIKTIQKEYTEQRERIVDRIFNHRTSSGKKRKISILSKKDVKEIFLTHHRKFPHKAKSKELDQLIRQLLVECDVRTIDLEYELKDSIYYDKEVVSGYHRNKRDSRILDTYHKSYRALDTKRLQENIKKILIPNAADLLLD